MPNAMARWTSSVHRPDPLNSALDEIQDRFGSTSIRRGTLADNEKASPSWQIKRGE